MKYQKLMSIILSVSTITLVACESDADFVNRRNGVDMNVNYPKSEIVGRVGTHGLIHKFHDEKTGVTCYFFENNKYDHISCVK